MARADFTNLMLCARVTLVAAAQRQIRRSREILEEARIEAR